ncbi:P-loop containing nucleoside triphosphate hydrolase protein [Suillus lakei]|nr:P-loop containing nucleoside triphosphate hydrolase protein [Suillus lakei]
MSMLSFNHVLALLLSWHTKRKTGSLFYCGSAVNRVGEFIGFTVILVLVDVVVALVVFVVVFEPALGILVGVDMGSYIWASVVLTRYRTRIRRQMNERDVVTRGFHTDCLLNYETVKYLSGVEYEAQRYTEAIGEYQSLERIVVLPLNLLNLVQTLIITSGLLVGSLIVASRITRGQSNTSDFVVFITYYAQLYFPLSNPGGVYRAINQGLVDTEKLLHLLNEPTKVVDEPDAKELVVTNEEVEFDNVSFAYDDQTSALHNITFRSGVGKNTILRLLYRFYDLQPGSGRILIDGQDIRTVALSSLRRAIGYNIVYGQPSTTPADENTIISKGYETNVGERGMRLSWDEKQRVAIDRTMATSALDSTTERGVLEGALGRLIMILKDGRIVEQGSHGELLELNGLFASMWADQISASEDPKAPAGYDVDDDAPVVNIPESETRSSAVEEHIAVDSPKVISTSPPPKADVPISFPTSAFPISDDPPQTFPTTASTSDSPSIHSHPERSAIPAHMQGASVTFDPTANPPSRAGSPEPKRALSTHNIQRLARKISLSDSSMASSVAGGSASMPPASGSDRESVDEPPVEVISKKEERKKKRKSFI